MTISTLQAPLFPSRRRPILSFFKILAHMILSPKTNRADCGSRVTVGILQTESLQQNIHDFKFAIIYSSLDAVPENQRVLFRAFRKAKLGHK
jgi:hypothetical protein